MASEVHSVTVKIQGRDYQLSCHPNEEESLRKAARYLDQQMASIKSRGSTLPFEKLTVMAAINLSHDLLQVAQRASAMEQDSKRSIASLEARIDSVLATSRQLEI